MSILYVLIAILLVGVLIIVHEAGHFWAARLTGIEVQEFAVGFGPKLVSWQSRKHGTRFSIRAIPMGGFCAFYGEDDAKGEHQDDARAYNRQPVWKRMLTVLMGPGMNFILAFVVMVLFFMLAGGAVPDDVPSMVQVAAGSPAAQAGIEPGDVIVEVNGQSVLDGTTDTLLAAIGSYRAGDAPLHLVIDRGGETVETDVTPLWNEQEGRYLMGVSIGYAYTLQRLSFPVAVRASWDNCVYASTMILRLLKQLVTTGEGLENTSGIVGAVSAVSQQVRTGGFEAFVNALVMLSINLGVMNLLPIPGLDGSRFLFQLLEAIRRKPVKPEREALVHLIGMVFLFGVMIFFTWRDVLNLLR